MPLGGVKGLKELKCGEKVNRVRMISWLEHERLNKLKLLSYNPI